MTSHRQRHKAHLDQHVRDVNGEYRYIGDWYALQGGKSRLYPFLAAVSAAGVFMIASGYITAAGLKNTWYVIIPYVFEVSLLFALCWQAVRLACGRGRLKAFSFENVDPRIKPLCGALALAALLSALCSGVFLLKNGPDGTAAACAGYFILKALIAAASLWARRAYGGLVWAKQ